MSLCKHGNAGLICVKIGGPLNTKDANKGTNADAFYTKARSNLRDSDKPAKMIMSSVVRSEIKPVMCSDNSSKRNSTATDDEIVIPSTPKKNDIDDYLEEYGDDDSFREMLQENYNTTYDNNIKES
jgi:hypothetical protein